MIGAGDCSYVEIILTKDACLYALEPPCGNKNVVNDDRLIKVNLSMYFSAKFLSTIDKYPKSLQAESRHWKHISKD